jgi:hypothetical protein
MISQTALLPCAVFFMSKGDRKMTNVDRKTEIYAIYARKSDGIEDMISERIKDEWVTYCSHDLGWIQSKMETARSLCLGFDRIPVLKTFVLEREKIIK